MNAFGIADSLYPVALALTNIGLGTGLYEAGVLAFALLLWLSGVLVLAGIVSSVTAGVTRRRERTV